jgi:hypothetical protein
MSQANFTPISLYYSTTASAVPTAANLVPGELAINTADGKLYYEDSSGVVQVLATKSTGSIGGSNTQVQFNNSGSLGGSSGLTWDGSFLTTSSIKNSALTNGRVTYAGASGLLVDSANLTFSGSLLAVTGTQTITNSSGSTLTLDRTSNPGSVQLNFNGTQTGQVQALSGGGLVFYQGSSPTEGFRLTPTSLYTASGVNVGIGTSSPSFASGGGLAIYNASAARLALKSNADGANNGLQLGIDNSGLAFIEQRENNALTFSTNSTERMRIDSSGNLGLPVVPSAWQTTSGSRAIQFTGSAVYGYRDTNLILTQNAYFDGGFKYYASSIASAYYGIGSGVHSWYTAPSGTANATATFTQAMTLDASGVLLVGKTTSGLANVGIELNTSNANYSSFTRSGGGIADFNRLSDDGELIAFWQDTNKEGNITVSGNTVSYNGGHLSRWSQWQNQTDKPEVYRGSVLESTNNMCQWNQTNEQVTKTIISNTPKSKAVAGVFDMYDNDDKTNLYDFYVAQSGDFVIRIAQGVVVENGDLLESAGDGTARPQTDDICRSSTIAKVTSNYVSTTYADGSFCVPCILMIG